MNSKPLDTRAPQRSFKEALLHYRFILFAAIVVCLLPLALSSGSLATEVLVYALAALGCNLLLGATISNDSRPPSQKCRDRVANLMRLSAIAAKKIAAGAMMPPAPLTIKASAQEIHTKYHHFCSPSRRRKYE